MAAHGSVTGWIERVRFGEDSKLEPIFERYFARLQEFAKPRIRSGSRVVSSEDDVALSVLRSLWEGLQRGSFGYVKNRRDLWSLLIRVSVRKIIDNQRRLTRRGMGRMEVRSCDVEARRIDTLKNPILERLAFEGDDPARVAHVVELSQTFLARLDGDEMRNVALLKIQGYTAAEIAREISKSTRTVERKLRIIRQTWDEVFCT